MNRIAYHLESDDLRLFNESFGTTNEFRRSEICHQIVQALIENSVKVYNYLGDISETIKEERGVNSGKPGVHAEQAKHR